MNNSDADLNTFVYILKVFYKNVVYKLFLTQLPMYYKWILSQLILCCFLSTVLKKTKQNAAVFVSIMLDSANCISNVLTEQ